MGQMALPTAVTEAEIERKRTLGAAIELCIEAGGFAMDKQCSIDLGFDKGQLSRWQSEQEGIMWHKLRKIMDACGNHAPVLWMLHQLGYDITSLRKRESENERELRIARERIVELERDKRVLVEAMNGRAT